jgi:hypothetical protein
MQNAKGKKSTFAEASADKKKFLSLHAFGIKRVHF